MQSLCMCDNLSACVKFAYVDAMLYLCMQYFMLYGFYVYGICLLVTLICACETSFVCEISNCPIVTIIAIGLVICDYVRGIPTLRHQSIS
jgi:hypothetical protein